MKKAEYRRSRTEEVNKTSEDYQLKKKFSKAEVFGRKIQNGKCNLKTKHQKRGKSPMDSIV